ncbi:MAG: chemotaxis protein CheW [Comamonas sp.]|uniref:chemotaxis protein CheW n=1 Tax=Comamonas sp. BIGb0152 TaxID=2940601 RepID=UPI002166D557|nr:chemotaxis protein CheW [Comamonas sp. BIGb0152]MCS4295149.1 twitching motility protein PilI [Comamonas sp. BIGb0152]
MAQREDLRELQTRLADRLSQARNQTAVGASWLAVKISGKNFLLPLSQSGEVLGWSGVEPVPYTKPWMLGVTSIRGILLTVVDLARMLGMPAARSEQVFASASVVALNPMMGVNAALFVEQLEGLRGTTDFSRSKDTPADAPEFFGALYTSANGEQWQELNLQLLANAPDFLDITV